MDKYRTFFPRFIAMLIDIFIMLPIGILEDWFRRAEFSPLFFYLWLPLAGLVAPVYRITMHGLYGQTLGKMAMNVRVLSVTEEPADFSRAFRREVPQLLFNAGLVYLGIAFFPQTLDAENVNPTFGVFLTLASVWNLANLLTFFLNDKRRALHDLIAGTVVVKTNV